MTPVISIVGEKNVGKTALLEKLIAELKRRGYRVGVAKHAHCQVDMDREGKDTWRYSQAGADEILVSAPTQLVFLKREVRTCGLQELVEKFFGEADVVLAEGFMGERGVKIEVFRRGVSSRLRCKREELLAVVSDVPLAASVPCFQPEEVREIADLIRSRVRKERMATEELSWP